ncbi:MAG: guanylate kinase [Oscillospiraceae bacterium]|nr:guanylate kinase [Oscillospiraceae bacterium]
MSETGKIFIVAGPSGAGKSTVLAELFRGRGDLFYSVSATTRDPRPGEADGVNYHFITADRFRQMINEDAFLECAEYVGNFYGTPKKPVDAALAAGKDAILEIEVQGAKQVYAKRPDAIRIFIIPPSWEELERRLVDRGTDTPEKIQKRLLRARVELADAREYDYIVLNDTVDKAAEELRAILRAEHCRVKDRIDRFLER